VTEASPLPVSVLVVTWNSASDLPVCLEALAESVPPPAELVIVDNASRDGTVAAIEAQARSLPFPVRVERRDTNTGFAAGMNRAIEISSADLLFLLNPDTRVTPGAIERLAGRMAAADSSVYAVGPKIIKAMGGALEPTDRIDSTGIRMTRDGRHFDRGAGDPDDGRWDAAGEVFGVSGAAVLLRRAALEEGRVDGQVFDEDFFAYREDADLAWRMRGFGYRALYEPHAVVHHRRRVTPAARRSLPAAINRHSVKNRFLLRIHHADLGWMAAFGIPSYLRDLVVLAACVTIERSSLPAFAWLLRNRRRHIRRRREILRRRQVTSKQLRRWFT
jgi:GT2 family glycosyltransferase